MQDNVFRSNKKNSKEKSLYFSSPFLDIYKNTEKNLFKNYIILPELKVLVEPSISLYGVNGLGTNFVGGDR